MDRRRFLGTVGAASLFGLAGCSSDGESGDGEEPDQDENTEPAETEDSGGDESEEDPGPTLAEFAYPAGATQDGVTGTDLYATHESTVTEAGSLTLERSRTDSFDGNEFSRSETNRFANNAIFREIDEDGTTELVWGPADEDLSYVQMESGFETGYRIESQSPGTNEVTGLGEFRQFLSSIEWSEAQEVLEVGDETYAVRYESVGQPDIFGDRLEAFAATITVLESGYVRTLEHSRTESDGTQSFEVESTLTLTAVGETTVDPPEWTETAREEGAQFGVSLTDDRTAYEVEMLNGSEVPTSARIRLRDRAGSSATSLSQPLSVGDRLSVALSESGELLLDPEGIPSGGRQLTGSTNLTIRSEFLLLEHGDRL